MRKFTARIIAFIAIAACVWAVAYYGFLRQDKQQYNFKTAKIEKKDIIQSIDATGTVEPDPELVAKYEDRYQKFRQIYPACRPLFEIIK